MNGKVTCLDCREKEREADRQRKQKALANETPEHRSKRLQVAKARRERLKAQGLCIRCGKRKALQGKQHCLECNIKRRRINRESKRRKTNKSAGISGVDTQGASQGSRTRRSKGGRWSWTS
ncbi:MAG: hypothetical protein IIZ94_00895 [Prevotella sp.]|nr:hypothetical protein [Prevotella sp.]